MGTTLAGEAGVTLVGPQPRRPQQQRRIKAWRAGVGAEGCAAARSAVGVEGACL